MRFLRVFLIVAPLAGVFGAVAQALDFNDNSEVAPPGEVGRVYNFPLVGHAGCDDAPYRWVVESGELAPGLTISSVDTHSGLIAGIPTAGGSWSAWIALKDHCGNSSEVLFTFNIGHRTYAITTADLPVATAGSPYSAKLQACCHPIQSETWTVSDGSLPAGLTLSSNGTISGTPTTTGSATFTAKATSVGDDGGIRLDTKQFMLSVSQPLAVTLSKHAAEVGAPFHAILNAAGGRSPYTWSATGTPAGVTVAANGAVAGVPATAGTYTLATHVTDTNGIVHDDTFTLVIQSRIAIVTRNLHPAVVGRSYRASIATGGGAGRLTWRIVRGEPPAGIVLNAHTGTLTGSARSAATSSFTVRVRDALGGVATRTFVLVAHG